MLFKMQDQLILAIRLVSDAESKIKNFKYNHCWHSCNLNGTFCDCGSQFSQQLSTTAATTTNQQQQSTDQLNKYEESLSVNRKGDDTKIGVVSTTFSNYDMLLKDFRKLMEKQIEELPPSFIFLYNNGYPLSQNQEKSIKLKHIASTDGIIDIKRKFNFNRYGIMSVYGEIFGFVFLNPNLSVFSIRTNIVKELEDIHSFKSMQNNFIFCDRNGWPINSNQEYNLVGWDLIHNNMIKIKPFKIESNKLLGGSCSSELDLNTTGIKQLNHNSNNNNGSTLTLFEDMSYVDGSATIINSNNSNTNNNSSSNNNSTNSDDNNQRHNVIQQEDYQQTNSYHSRHTFKNSNSTNHYQPHSINNNSNNNSSNDFLNDSNDRYFYRHSNLITDQALVSKSQSAARHKPILISYVRKEAEQHARNLKAQLTMLGCDVYLDVDEITVGMDWADALNEAVNSCEIFIPLVTPNYGLTLWTNRECKFADMKEKYILPINFLRHWPPTCLAIQFATTQFLPWKTKEELEEDYELESSKANDITYWEERSIVRTAQQINELIKKRSITVKVNEIINHDHSVTGDEDNITDELQSNSLDNSIEDNTNDIEISDKVNNNDDDEDDDLKENVDNNLVKLVNNNNDDITEVDSRTPSQDNAKISNSETDLQLLDNQLENKIEPFVSFASLSAFSNLPPIKKAIPPPPLQLSSTGNTFNDKILNTLTIKSCKKENCESIKITKRSFKQPKPKKLIAISAHPAQKLFVDNLKAKLSAHYEVWSSTDMIPAYTSYNSTISSTYNIGLKDDFTSTRSEKISTSLNSLSSSVTNSIQTDTDQEINDYNSNNQNNNFVQNFDFSNSLTSSTTLDPDTRSASIDIFNKTVSCHRVEKQSTRFDKCYYRNQVTKSVGKSQWYIDSPTDLNSQSCILQPDEIDKVNIFKEKVNEARVVIILLSEDYCESRTSKRQAYYCDFRKQILPINLEDVKNESHWVGKLMDNPYLIQKSDCLSDTEMMDKVNAKISNIIKSEEKLNCQLTEKKTEEFAEFIQKKLTVHNKKKLYIFVLGSTKFVNSKTKELCEKIGRCLAKKPPVILVTGGALGGVADTIAQSFYEERKRIRSENRKQSTTSLDNSNQENKNLVLHCNSNSDDQQKIDINSLDVIHILPKGQVGELKYKYRSKEDGTFEPLPYGHTVFLGETIEHRDCTVSRVFPFCLLIGGGKTSAKLAQDFIYNENIVIPVCNTGGAAAGNYISEEDCGNNICQMPAGVNEDDWVNLNKRDLPICELGNTIFNIIDSLSNYHLSAVRCKLFDTMTKKIYKKKKTPHKKLASELFIKTN